MYVLKNHGFNTTLCTQGLSSSRVKATARSIRVIPGVVQMACWRSLSLSVCVHATLFICCMLVLNQLSHLVFPSIRVTKYVVSFFARNVACVAWNVNTWSLTHTPWISSSASYQRWVRPRSSCNTCKLVGPVIRGPNNVLRSFSRNPSCVTW